MEHIPDVGLQDIEEEDEEEIEEEIESENELDEEDAPKVTFNQDGVTSDEIDMESFSKSHNFVELFTFLGLHKVLSGLLGRNHPALLNCSTMKNCLIVVILMNTL